MPTTDQQQPWSERERLDRDSHNASRDGSLTSSAAAFGRSPKPSNNLFGRFLDASPPRLLIGDDSGRHFATQSHHQAQLGSVPPTLPPRGPSTVAVHTSTPAHVAAPPFVTIPATASAHVHVPSPHPSPGPGIGPSLAPGLVSIPPLSLMGLSPALPRGPVSYERGISLSMAPASMVPSGWYQQEL